MSEHPEAREARSDTPAEPARRDALAKVALACGGVLGAAVLIGPAGVALTPLIRPERDDADARPGDDWLVVDSAQRFVVGAPPARVVVRRDVRDQWLMRRGETLGAVLVDRLSEGEFHVLSATCPHLGCSVVWADSQWRCPCHKSAFARDGALVPNPSGPPNPSPRALDPLEWRVHDGRLEVRWVRFQTGISERRAV
jgi:Rieske Fe-S protein